MTTQNPNDDNFYFDPNKLTEKQKSAMIKAEQLAWNEKEAEILKNFSYAQQFEYRKHMKVIEKMRQDQLVLMYKQLMTNYIIKERLVIDMFGSSLGM